LPVDALARTASPVSRRTSTRERLVKVARPVVGGLVLLAIAYAVASEWSGVRGALHTLDWQSVALSMVAAFLGTVTAMLAWRALLADEGYPLTALGAGRIFFVGQLGKYLPGSVFSIVLQMELGKWAGVPRGRTFTTSLAWVGLSLSTGLTVGLLGLPVLANTNSNQVWALLVVLPFAVVASAPPVLTRLVNLVLKVMRKGPLPKPLSWGGVLRASLLLGATWIFFGLHLWLLANALGAPGLSGITRCVGGFSLAMAAGVVFIVVPSGAGVREAILVAALAPVMSAGEALGIALVSRAIFIACDVATAGAAALSGVRQVRLHRAAAGPAEALSANEPTAPRLD
jgi:uncharacterized membrane protein YbhN (UPF0104 family)